MARYNEVARRFRLAMSDKMMTAQELSARSGVGKSSISHYVNGTNCPSNKNAGVLAEVLGVNPAWLMDVSDERFMPIKGGASEAVQIPVLGDVAAGIPILATENILDWEEIPAHLAAYGTYFGLRIKGDSMSPRMMEGDVVIVREQPDVESGDVAIIRVNGENATCKRVLKNGNSISLISFNPLYAPKTFTKKDIEETPVEIIGKVVELRGKF